MFDIVTFSAEIKIRCHLLHQPWTEAKDASYFSGSTVLRWRSSTVTEQGKTENLSSDIQLQRTRTRFLSFQRRDHFFVHQTRKQSTCLVSDEPNKHKCQNIGCIQPRMWHLLVAETASESLHVRPLLPPLPEQPQLWKHFQTPARSTWNKVFTKSGWLLVGSELPACSAIQERVDKLTVVLAEARLITDVVEFTCKVR